MSRRDEEIPMAVRVPANVDKPDTIAFGLTGRHLSLVTLVGLGLWLLFEATRPLVPFLVFAAVAVPVAGVTAALVLIRRHGLGLDELLLAALKQRHAPRRLVPTPNGAGVPGVPTWVTAAPEALPAPLRLPAHSISLGGAIDLDEHGVAAQCACTGVNFGLRTPAEQHGLVAGFARWLHSLAGPTQIVVRADRLDLTPLITALRDGAPALPHPALETACRDHAAFLDHLARTREVLRRQILLAHREPARPGAGGRDTAGQVVLRRASEAIRGLAAAEVTVTPLDGARVQTVLTSAADPHGSPTRPRGTTRHGVVTGTPHRPVEVTP